jgi:hypothetical protein
MARFKTTIDGQVPLSAEEEAQRDADEAKHLVDKPMNDWQKSMRLSDASMPRWLEDHIEADHSGVAANPYQQAAYDAKKALRGSKP